MAAFNTVKLNRTIIGKLENNKDLLNELLSVCQHEKIQLGRISAIGAVRKARIGFYDQNTRRYEFIELDQNLEISSLIGNISVREGNPAVHAHITLCDCNGKAYGGHLAEGTTVFACEFIIDVYDGPQYIREYDETTGLPLWKI